MKLCVKVPSSKAKPGIYEVSKDCLRRFTVVAVLLFTVANYTKEKEEKSLSVDVIKANLNCISRTFLIN